MGRSINHASLDGYFCRAKLFGQRMNRVRACIRTLVVPAEDAVPGNRGVCLSGITKPRWEASGVEAGSWQLFEKPEKPRDEPGIFADKILAYGA